MSFSCLLFLALAVTPVAAFPAMPQVPPTPAPAPTTYVWAHDPGNANAWAVQNFQVNGQPAQTLPKATDDVVVSNGNALFVSTDTQIQIAFNTLIINGTGSVQMLAGDITGKFVLVEGTGQLELKGSSSTTINVPTIVVKSTRNDGGLLFTTGSLVGSVYVVGSSMQFKQSDAKELSGVAVYVYKTSQPLVLAGTLHINDQNTQFVVDNDITFGQKFDVPNVKGQFYVSGTVKYSIPVLSRFQVQSANFNALQLTNKATFGSGTPDMTIGHVSGDAGTTFQTRQPDHGQKNSATIGTAQLDTLDVQSKTTITGDATVGTLTVTSPNGDGDNEGVEFQQKLNLQQLTINVGTVSIKNVSEIDSILLVSKSEQEISGGGVVNTNTLTVQSGTFRLSKGTTLTVRNSVKVTPLANFLAQYTWLLTDNSQLNIIDGCTLDSQVSLDIAPGQSLDNTTFGTIVVNGTVNMVYDPAAQGNTTNQTILINGANVYGDGTWNLNTNTYLDIRNIFFATSTIMLSNNRTAVFGTQVAFTITTGMQSADPAFDVNMNIEGINLACGIACHNISSSAIGQNNFNVTLIPAAALPPLPDGPNGPDSPNSPDGPNGTNTEYKTKWGAVIGAAIGALFVGVLLGVGVMALMRRRQLGYANIA